MLAKFIKSEHRDVIIFLAHNVCYDRLGWCLIGIVGPIHLSRLFFGHIV